LALLMIVRMAEPELRYEEEWGNLDIDRQAGAAS
jgi:hypothetical protein